WSGVLVFCFVLGVLGCCFLVWGGGVGFCWVWGGLFGGGLGGSDALGFIGVLCCFRGGLHVFVIFVGVCLFIDGLCIALF
ncbi:hypothetical protein ABTP29_17820, partial [Acinetobacter baumannii]